MAHSGSVGGLYARLHREQFSSCWCWYRPWLPVRWLCQLFSSGGFYFFSGRYENPTFPGCLSGFVTYYPQYLSRAWP